MTKSLLSILVFLFDLSAVAFAWVGGFLLRFNLDMPANFLPVLGWGLVFLLPAHAVACRLAGLYRGIWMFASLPDLKRVLSAVGFSTAAVVGFFAFYRYGQRVVPRSLLVLYPMLLTIYMGGGRAAYRMWKEHRLYGWKGESCEAQPRVEGVCMKDSEQIPQLLAAFVLSVRRNEQFKVKV